VPDAFKNKSGKAFALCVVLFVVGILVVLSFTLWLLLSGEIIELYDTVNEYRGLGGLMFGMIFAIANLPFMVGYGILLMINGLIFGFWWGMLIAVIGSFCGWFPSFILVRKAFFADAKHYVKTKGGYFARSIMLELEEHKVKVSLALRLIPGPPGFQTTILAVSPTNIFTFVWTSFVGLSIKQIAFVYIGHSITVLYQLYMDTGEADSAPSSHKASLIIGAIGTVLIIAVGAYISRRANKRARELKQQEAQENAHLLTPQEENEVQSIQV